MYLVAGSVICVVTESLADLSSHPDILPPAILGLIGDTFISEETQSQCSERLHDTQGSHHAKLTTTKLIVQSTYILYIVLHFPM